MHSDCIAYDKQEFKFVMINIVGQCIAFKLLMISIVVQCIGIQLLMIRIVV